MTSLRQALDDVEKVVNVLQIRDSGMTVPGFDRYTTKELATHLVRLAADVFAAASDPA